MVPASCAQEDHVNIKHFEFEQFEEKFLLPLVYKNEFLNLLEQHLNPSYLFEGTTHNKIESIYFDSERFDFYYDHIFKAPERFKIRLRRYGKNGVFNEQDCYLMELKTKKINEDEFSGKTIKNRIYLSSAQVNDLYQGNYIALDDICRAFNRTLGEQHLLKTVKKLNTLLIKYHPVPCAIVTYTRKAFEKEGFRVTCDDELVFTNLLSPEIVVQNEYTNSLHAKFNSHAHAVIELKYKDEIPVWIQEYFARIGISRDRFSKYCYSISEQVRMTK